MYWTIIGGATAIFVGIIATNSFSFKGVQLLGRQNNFWPVYKEYFFWTGLIIGLVLFPMISWGFAKFKAELGQAWIAQLTLQVGSFAGAAFFMYLFLNEIPRGRTWLAIFLSICAVAVAISGSQS